MKKYIILILILASVLRLYKLTTLPALNADEAAIGYNAYSLLETGRDEHGNPWPIHFQSFNDYKPGLYFYIVMPFVKILGLTEMAISLPGALLGILTVYMLWLLIRELFPKNIALANISALFLATSPWHIHFSRGGWEVSVATFFITAGVWGFLKGLKDKKWLYISVILFVASLYTYHAARIIVPLLVVGVALIKQKELFSKKAVWLKPALLGLFLCIPLILNILGPEARARAAGVGLFADPGPLNRINEQRGEHGSLDSKWSKLFHNKLVNYSLAFAQNYFDHFQGQFLFLSGDEIQRNKVPDVGEMYLFDLVFLLAGFWALSKNIREWRTVLLWLFAAPLAAALTFQSPHAVRAQNMVIPLVIISAYGALSIWECLGKVVKNKSFLLILYSLFSILCFWDFTRYLHEYWIHMAKTYDFSSQYGVKELVQYVDKNYEKYPEILVTDRYDQPYILFLFYLKYPPSKFQNNHTLTARDEFGFSTVEQFDKFKFTSIGAWETAYISYAGDLIAGTSEEIPSSANVIKQIYFPSGRIAFRVVAN